MLVKKLHLAPCERTKTVLQNILFSGRYSRNVREKWVSGYSSCWLRWHAVSVVVDYADTVSPKSWTINIKLIKLYYLGKEENCVEVDKNSFDIFEKLWSWTWTQCRRIRWLRRHNNNYTNTFGNLWRLLTDFKGTIKRKKYFVCLYTQLQ